MRIGRISLRLAQKVIDILNDLIDWIYPPQCRVCGKDPDVSPFLCNDCYRELLICDDSPDSVAYHKDHPADEVKTLFYFDETLQKLIHEIKYLDASYIAEFFGKELGRYYKDRPVSRVDAIIPVPLYSVRQRERTYNQSACLAKGIASEWKIPVLARSVKRTRSTGTQTQLNKVERQENIKGAFKIRHIEKLPESVCVVDDVFTTGATTMELARTLKNAGVGKVTILCLATPLREKKGRGEKER